MGPDGTAGTFFTTPGGEALDASTEGRYCRHRAYLSGDTPATPSDRNMTGRTDGTVTWTYAWDEDMFSLMNAGLVFLR